MCDDGVIFHRVNTSARGNRYVEKRATLRCLAKKGVVSVLIEVPFKKCYCVVRNKFANGVLRDFVHRFYQGIRCFQNSVGLHGTRKASV